VFRGKFGVSHGQQAVQIEERVARSKLKVPDIVMLTRRP
jgi:flagellar motor switch protein FliM